jgi:hypothetical protein
MRVLFILITVLFLGNCSTLFFKPETRVVPICEFGEKIKGLDYTLIDIKKYPKNHKVERLKEKMNEYEKQKTEILAIGLPIEYNESILSTIQNRIDTIRLSLATRAEKEGDIYSTQYNFSKALESYQDGLYEVSSIEENNKTANILYDKLQKKIQITKENGENFLNNRIKSLIDQAIFLNLDDQVSKAKSAMKQAEKELESSLFTNPKIVSLYTEQAKVMNFFDNEIDTSCKANLTLGAKSRIEKLLPENYITKSGIKFTKIKTRDGKSIYISEIIRNGKGDSWYFARDFAKKIGLDENCPDCYRLPNYEEIENFKGEIIGYKHWIFNGTAFRWEFSYLKERDGVIGLDVYEGFWLNSWSFAPFGITIGNISVGFYTIDFLHDVAFHPLTWQSYIYPISPDSAIISGGSWDLGARIIRTASRIDSDINFIQGFRIVRPLE